MSDVIAVDDGFAQTKLSFFKKNQKANLANMLIPSLAAQGAGDIMDMSGQPVSGFETEGQTFTVGRVSTAASTNFDDFKASPLNRVIVHEALLQAGFGGQHVNIGVSLPFNQFYDSPLMIERRKKSFTIPVRKLGVQEDETPLAIIDSVRVYPESAVAWFDVYIDDEGQERHGINDASSIAIIDIGGRTTDISVFHGPGMIDRKRSGTINKGVHDVVNMVAGSLGQFVNMPDAIFNVVNVESAIRSGSINIFGVPKDITPLIARARRQVADQIYTALKAKFNTAHFIDRIVFIGGGARVLKDELVSHKEFPHAEVMENPEYSNARGILKYMTFVEGLA